MKLDGGAEKVAGDDYLAQSALLAASDTSAVARTGLFVLIISLGGFGFWAGTAPLAEGIPTVGTVVIDKKAFTIQHLTGGRVAEVMVGEGQVVEENQALIRLDAAASRANFESIRQRFLGLSAVKSRLMAEKNNVDFIAFSDDILAAAKDPFIGAQLENQRQLFISKRESLRASLAEVSAGMASIESQRESASTMLIQRKTQFASLQDQVGHLRELVREGYAPRNRLLELERELTDVATAITNLEGNIRNSESSMAQLQQRRLARQAEYLREVESELAEVSSQVAADAERYRALSMDLERVVIRSPAQGQVVGLSVQNVGAVAAPGQKLMDIVPNQPTLIVETRIPPHLIDKVSVGLVADVRFNTFSRTPQLVVDGVVQSVSGDLLKDSGYMQEPYYLARLALTADGMRKLGSHQMQAGMPVEVVIKTGSRTLLEYLSNPLIRRFATSLKEE